MATFSPAFFINPKGQVLYVGRSHISAIIKNPKKFGFPKEWIEAQYKRFGERMGQEGKAREFIIRNLIEDGWIHIRRYGDNHWNFNVWNTTGKVKEYIKKFARAMIKGTNDFKEEVVEMPANIFKMFLKRTQKTTMDDIANGLVIVEDRRKKGIYSIKFVESLDEMNDIRIIDKYLK